MFSTHTISPRRISLAILAAFVCLAAPSFAEDMKNDGMMMLPKDGTKGMMKEGEMLPMMNEMKK